MISVHRDTGALAAWGCTSTHGVRGVSIGVLAKAHICWVCHDYMGRDASRFRSQLLALGLMPGFCPLLQAACFEAVQALRD